PPAAGPAVLPRQPREEPVAVVQHLRLGRGAVAAGGTGRGCGCGRDCGRGGGCGGGRGRRRAGGAAGVEQVLVRLDRVGGEAEDGDAGGGRDDDAVVPRPGPVPSVGVGGRDDL